MPGDLIDAIITAAEWLVERRRAIALTGAGVSVPSGIPDFRSPGGIWERYEPGEYATLPAFLADPVKVWRFLRDLDELLEGAGPNPAHRALARLEAVGVLDAVITQNIDHLHQEAGSRRVVEYHGSHALLMCPACEARRPPSEVPIDENLGIPLCECGHALKPDVILFGEAIPVRALLESMALAGEAAMVIVAGTSAEVAPASEIPALAAAHGARVVEVNVEPTRLTGTVTDLFLQGPAEEILPRLADEVEARLGPGAACNPDASGDVREDGRSGPGSMQ